MKLQIKSMFVWGNANIRTWAPSDTENFAEMVFFDVGAKGKKEAHQFHIKVATLKGLTNLEASRGIVAVRPLLVVDTYDFNYLWNWIEETVRECEADTWNACVDKLQIHFGWEYEE